MSDLSAAKITAASVVPVAVIGLIGTIITVRLNSDDDEDAPAAARVASVSLTAPITSFGSRCPFTLQFVGTIDVESGTSEIVYRWLRSDGFGGQTQNGDRQRASADGPGSIRVLDEWTPNIPVGEVARTATLEILEPVSLRSNSVVIAGLCDAAYPPGPSIPPPQVPGGPPG